MHLHCQYHLVGQSHYQNLRPQLRQYQQGLILILAQQKVQVQRQNGHWNGDRQMEELRNIYKKRFFARRNSMNWRAPIMAKAIIDMFNPSSIIDVGCATGDILRAIEEMDGNVVIRGIEGSDQAIEYFEVNFDRIFVLDLRFSISLHDVGLIVPADLCMSLEVAEHIEPEYAEQYVNNLCNFSDRILLTAAPPGQGGHHHVNCQFPSYWERLFNSFGFIWDIDTTLEFKRQLKPWAHKKGIKAYYDNALYFYRDDSKDTRREKWWEEMINQ